MTRTMRAAVIREAGGPEVLRIEDLPVPEARAGEVLIRVEAFGLNRSEMFTRQGLSPNVRFPRVLGIEAVGTVAEAPGGEFEAGDTVATVMGGIHEPVGRLDPYRHLRVLREETRKQRRYSELCERVGAGYPERPGQFAALVHQGGLDRPRKLLDRPRMGQQQGSGLGQREAARGPPQKTRSDRALQHRDPLADRRLRNADRPRGRPRARAA